MGGGCQVRGRGAVGRVGDHRFVVISAVTDLLLLLLLLLLLRMPLVLLLVIWGASDLPGARLKAGTAIPGLPSQTRFVNRVRQGLAVMVP